MHSFKRIQLIALALLMAAAAAPQQSAASEDNYLGILLNYVEPDSERRVDGQGLGASFLYGHALSAHWNIETRLTALTLERGNRGGTDFYQQDLGVDAVYQFGGVSGWRPFALAGVSVMRNDVDLADLDDVGAAANIGAGISSPALGRMGMRIRTEVRYVHDDYLDGRQDIRLGVGIHIPLGGSGAVVDTAIAKQRTGTQRRDDADQDGVSDAIDRCPNSLPYVEHDDVGCMKPNQVLRMYEVTFANGTAVLTSGAREELSDVVRALRGQPDLPVRIDGHTDSSGDRERNRELSLDRAEAVATYLVLQGIPTQRLSVRGHGESEPVATNATAEGRQRNRRIEIVLLEPAGH